MWTLVFCLVSNGGLVAGVLNLSLVPVICVSDIFPIRHLVFPLSLWYLLENNDSTDQDWICLLL